MPASNFDVIILQLIGGVWSEIVLTPAINEYLQFNGAKELIVGPLGSATPLAHAPSHAPAGSDPLPWASGINGRGLNAARPAAAAVNAGYRYFSTDVSGGTLYRSNGTIWEQESLGLTEPMLLTGDQTASGFKTFNSPIFGNATRAIQYFTAVEVVSLLVTGVAADISFNIFAKGNGSLVLGSDGSTSDVDIIIQGLTSQLTWTAATGLLEGSSSASFPTIRGFLIEDEYVSDPVPLTGELVATNTVKRNETVVITPAGTLAALTFELPASADARIGQTISVFITEIITALTVQVDGGGTIRQASAPNTSAANSSFAYRCVSVVGTGIWIRIY